MGPGGNCDSIDECTAGTHFCHALSTTCTNLDGKAGKYECTCKDGFETDPSNSYACKDINECEPANRDEMPCNTMHGSCENTEGGYDCKCKDGFLVGKKMKKTVNDKQIDFQECVNIDECATNAGWFQILKFREALEVMNFSTDGIDG